MKTRLDISERRVVYDGFWRVEELRLRHGLFAGGLSEPLTRELAHRGHAVGVLPYDPGRDRVILVEQFRIGALDDPREPWLIEIIAGMVEAGETAEDVARREAHEEAGCELGELVPVSRYYSSPGGCSEHTTVFCARVDCEGIGGIHGEASEGEDIRVHVVDFEEALAMVEAGVIRAAMPIIALQWLALKRERLQARWS